MEPMATIALRAARKAGDHRTLAGGGRLHGYNGCRCQWISCHMV